MEIELSEDLQYYKESFVLGLTVKQTFFSILALGTGTAIVLLLYTKIGVTLSCYVAMPFVVPLALTGFYNYHGLTFWQFAGKMVHFAFFNRPLLYWSTESVEELGHIFSEEKQEEQKAGKRKADPGKEKDVGKARQESAEIKNRKKRMDSHRKRKRIELAENGADREKKGMEIAEAETNRKRKPAGMVIRRAVGMIFAIACIYRYEK